MTGNLNEIRVSDLMTSELFTCRTAMPVAAVASLLARRRVHAGVISVPDLVVGVLALWHRRVQAVVSAR
jgi:predicted transcriptional regulator